MTITQTWTTESYGTHARFVSDLAAAVVEWLDPKPGERILDVGCGDGVLTADLVRSGAVMTGVDSSPNFVQSATGKGLDVRLMSGEALTFEPEFDAVFSNAALHWMTNAEAVVQGVARALKPGGRFVAEFGGHGNVAAICTAMRAVGLKRGGDLAIANPWFFPAPAVYQALLEREGFTVKRIGLFPRPTSLPTGMGEWLKLFRKPFFEQFVGEEDAALAETVALLKPALCDALGNWTADYVRLRVEAVKS